MQHVGRKKFMTCAVEPFLGNTFSSQTFVNFLVEYRTEACKGHSRCDLVGEEKNFLEENAR